MTPPSENSPLVIHTEFASAHFPENSELLQELERENWYTGAVIGRYSLKDRAADLLPGFRVNTACMRPIIPNRSFQVWRDHETGKAHIHGVARCGSAWVCPVCATKISMGRRAEIKEALAAAESMGWSVLFVTLTASHTREDQLADLFQKFKAAKRQMRSGRAWQSVKRDYLVKGSITATEITWGFANGWHVHFHEIFFIGSRPDPGAVEDLFFSRWYRSLESVGLSCNREHGVRVQSGSDKVGEYITKWGLDQELAGLGKAGRRGSFTPFQLLALYDQGEDWAGGLFQTYAHVTKGKISLSWSRGLRSLMGLNEARTDKELAEDSPGEDSALLVKLTNSQYRKLIYSGRVGVLGELLAAAREGQEALLIWLDALFDIKPELPP